MTPRVREVLEWYNSESPGVVTNLARLLNSGKLSGTGKLCIFNSSESFLASPVEKFATNPNSYDPSYHFELAISSGASAYIGSLGSIQSCARSFAGEIPTILSLNTFENEKSVLLATTADALRLGCVGVSLAINAEGSLSADNLNQIQRVLASAQQVGLPLVVNILSNNSIDLLAEAVRATAEMGAQIITLTIPAENFASPENKKIYTEGRVRTAKLYDRIKHIMDCSLGGKRIVLFEEQVNTVGDELINETKEIARGGGFGSIVGLTALKQSKDDSVKMFEQIMMNFKSD